MNSPTEELEADDVLDEPLMKPTELAKFLNVDRSTAYRLADAPNGIPAVKFNGNLRFFPAEVRAFVNRHVAAKQPPTRAARLIAAMQVAETPGQHAATPSRSSRTGVRTP